MRVKLAHANVYPRCLVFENGSLFTLLGVLINSRLADPDFKMAVLDESKEL